MPECGNALRRNWLEHNGHPKAITQVAIDMSPAYTKGVRDNFGQRGDRVDKFHVVSQVTAGGGGSAAQGSAAGRAGAGAVGKDQLVVAQESRKLDRTESNALGAIERQAAGDGPGVCDAAWNCNRRMRRARARQAREPV